MLNEIPEGDPRGGGGGVVGNLAKKVKNNKKSIWRVLLIAIIVLAIYALAA